MRWLTKTTYLLWIKFKNRKLLINLNINSILNNLKNGKSFVKILFDDKICWEVFKTKLIFHWFEARNWDESWVLNQKIIIYMNFVTNCQKLYSNNHLIEPLMQKFYRFFDIVLNRHSVKSLYKWSPNCHLIVCKRCGVGVVTWHTCGSTLWPTHCIFRGLFCRFWRFRERVGRRDWDHIKANK